MNSRRACRSRATRACSKNPPSSGGEFEYIAHNEDGLLEGIDRKQAEKEIHVVDHGGHVHRNADGMMEILDSSLRWRRLAVIGRLPIIGTVARRGYRLMAKYRHGYGK